MHHSRPFYDRWYFENFDPFRDNNALARVAKILTHDSCAATKTNT